MAMLVHEDYATTSSAGRAISDHQLVELARYLTPIAAAVSSSATDTEDLIQETLVRVIEHAADVQTNLHGYGARILRNLATDAWRKHGRVEVRGDPTAGLAVDAIEADVDLARAMARLSPTDQMLVYLTYVGGHPSAEAGGRLGMSAAHARLRLTRSRRQLRNWL